MFKKRFGATASCNAASTACGGEPASTGCGGNSGCDGSGAEIHDTPPSPNSRRELFARYSSVFDFEAVDIHEQNQALSKYKGNVTLVVNVASY